MSEPNQKISPERLKITINPHVLELEAYVPGEQPRDPELIKLNTNENPYPPSPHALNALRNAEANLLRKYPDPVSEKLRQHIGERFKLSPAQILIGNGSDELLRMICHAFAQAGQTIGMLHPTYSLYPVLGEMFGLRSRMFPVDFAGRLIGSNGANNFPGEIDLAELAIFFIANPNPPYGTLYPAQWIAELAAGAPQCLIVIDEAYVDFAPAHCLELARAHENVLVVRTFSKSASLAGMRVGYAIGQSALIGVLNRIRDSYNVNAISQAAALAAFLDEQYYRICAEKIGMERERVREAMLALGLQVAPSQGNFLFARCANARLVYQQLRERHILVRYFSDPPLDQGMRITIGAPEQNDRLLEALGKIVVS